MSLIIPLGTLAVLAIIFAFINFFLFSFFLTIARRTIVSARIYWTDFAIFSLNESFLGADGRSGPLFRYLKGRCHGNQFCGKMANSPDLSLWHSEMEWDIATSMCALTAW